MFSIIILSCPDSCRFWSFGDFFVLLFSSISWWSDLWYSRPALVCRLRVHTRTMSLEIWCRGAFLHDFQIVPRHTACQSSCLGLRLSLVSDYLGYYFSSVSWRGIGLWYPRNAGGIFEPISCDLGHIFCLAARLSILLLSFPTSFHYSGVFWGCPLAHLRSLRLA